MTAPKPLSPDDICSACGGSGVAYRTFGPFFSSVQKRWREAVAAHVGARHEVFRLIDRDIAGQLLKVLKTDVTSEEILAEAGLSLDRATKAWLAGKEPEAVRALLATLTRLLYLVECVEVARTKRAQE